jgi:uncharacterized protein YbjT (DUF2867 family)
MMNAKHILVTGATGQQGGAVARHLLKKSGFAVRALVRDPEKPAAKALAQSGVELMPGDLEDLPSIKRAIEGVYGVYSVQNSMEAGYEGEVRQGKVLAEAAHGAGVRHFVYSSAASADQQTGVPQLDSKWEIEQHLHQSGLPFTILRPAFFMQNWHNSLREPILHGTIPLPLDPHTPLSQISVDDIGAFAAMAFRNPDKWVGRTIELAGEELTLRRVAEIFSLILGRAVTYVQVPWEQFRQNAGEDLTTLYLWLNEVGYRVDVAAVRREYPALATLEQVLRRQNWTEAEAAVRKAA